MTLRIRREPRRTTLLHTVLVVLVIFPSAAAAQVVTGRAVDAVTGAPVAGVTIRAIDAGTRPPPVAVTDSLGHFTVAVPAGQHAFRAEHMGYETVETDGIAVARGEHVEVEIRLGPRPFDVEPLLVRARQRSGASTFHRRMALQKSTGQGRFITREEIAASGAAGINELLTRQPELVTIWNRERMVEVVAISSRGRATSPCVPVVYLDGVRVMNDEANPLDLATVYQLDALEGIEIYSNPMFAPPDLRTNGCGAIALWTRLDGVGNTFTLRRIVIASGWIGAFLVLRAL